MMKTKRKLLTAVLAGVIGISAMSMGYASWKTDIIANGNVRANAKWEVNVTAANLEVSEGAEAALDYSNYQLNNVCTSANISQVALQVGNNRASNKANVGKELTKKANNTMSGWVWLVDTTRFDMNRLGYLDSEPRRLLMLAGLENGSIIRLNEDNTAPDGTIVPAFNGWYGGNTYYNGTSFLNISKESATSIVKQLITKSDSAIKQLRPDTYQNYALILCTTSGPNYQPENQFVIASMGAADGTESLPVEYTDTAITYSDVTFSLPGAWAKYTLTVTNNGTVNANLADAVIELETEKKDQLKLETPDLSGEVLKPGENCTLTFVVKVPETYEGAELNATGILSVKLPYAQDTVEAAPEAGHTHGE